MDPLRTSVKLRDFSGGHWYRVHYEVLDSFLPTLGKEGIVLYSVLARYARDETVSNKSVQFLAGRAGMSRTTAFKLLKKLEQCSLVTRKPEPGRTSDYFLLPVRRLDSRGGGSGGPVVGRSGRQENEIQPTQPAILRSGESSQALTTPSEGSIWAQVKQLLKSELDVGSYETYFRDTVQNDLKDGLLFLLVPDVGTLLGFEKFSKRIWSHLPSRIRGIQPILPPTVSQR